MKNGTIKVIPRDNKPAFELTMPEAQIADDCSNHERRKAAPRNLESYRILLINDKHLLLSGKDGAFYTILVDDLTSQDQFDKRIRLVADGGHNMPILQLLKDSDECEQTMAVSLGYDRTLLAWSVQEHSSLLYVDKHASLACLGQTIDPDMLAFADDTWGARDELIVVQNRPSCQKILQLELCEEGALRTTDLTSVKVLDRSAPISAISMSSGPDSSLMVIVYDEVRLAVYDYLEKEVVRKFKGPAGQNIKAVALNVQANSLAMLLANKES